MVITGSVKRPHESATGFRVVNGLEGGREPAAGRIVCRGVFENSETRSSRRRFGRHTDALTGRRCQRAVPVGRPSTDSRSRYSTVVCTHARPLARLVHDDLVGQFWLAFLRVMLISGSLATLSGGRVVNRESRSAWLFCCPLEAVSRLGTFGFPPAQTRVQTHLRACSKPAKPLPGIGLSRFSSPGCFCSDARRIRPFRRP